MKKVFLIFLLLLSSIFGDELTKIKLQLQWKHQFEFAGFYAAKERGFYKDAGLDVQFLEYKDDESITDSVLNNKADFALTYSSLIAEYLKGKPVVLLANYFKQSPLVLISQPQIKTPKDLKNKKIMGVSDDIDSITLKLMLKKFGIKHNDIINVPTTFSIDDFKNKKVDAMAVFTTNEIYDLDKSGVKYNVFNPSLYGYEYYDVNLFTSKIFAQNNPLLVEKFKQASNKGWKYALAHQNEIIDLIIQKYNTQHKTKEALAFEAKQIEQIMFTKSEPIGSIDPLRIQLIAKNFIEAGFVTTNNLHTLDKFTFLDTNYNKSLELSQEEKGYLKNNTIKIGMVKDYYPFSYIDNEKISGFSYEYFKLLASKVGLKYDITLDNWSTTLKNFKQRKTNIIDAISYTKPRESFTNFTKPYFNIPNVIFARKNTIPSYKGLQSLKGKRVGITKEIYYYDTIKNLNLFDLVTYESSREKIKALAHGKIDAAFNNLTSGQKYILQGGYSNLEVLDEISDAIVKKEDLRLGVEKENIILYSIIQKAMNLVTSTEKLQLIDKYFNLNSQKNTLVTKNENEISQSVKKIAESISEYIWIYRLDLLADSLKRWIEYFGYEAALVYDNELDEYSAIWKENNTLKQQVSSKKPEIKSIRNYKTFKVNIHHTNKKLGTLTIFYDPKKFQVYPTQKVKYTFKEQQWLENNPNIILGADELWMPFDFKNRYGQHEGFNADYMDLIRKKLGIDIKIELGKWSTLQKKVQNKEIAGLIGAAKTPERDKYMIFTEPYVFIPQIIVVKNDNIPIKSLEELYGKTLGVREGNSQVEYFKTNYPQIKIKLFNTYSDILEAVSFGQIDAGELNLGSASYEMKKSFITNIKIAFKYGPEADMRIGIRKDWPELISILQKAIDSISLEELNKILKEWLLSSNTPQKEIIELNLNQQKYLQAKDHITLCIDPDWEPYEVLTSSGKHTGLAADFIKLIERKIDKKFEIIPTQTWDESLKFIKQGKCEVVSFLNETPQRKTYMNFTPTLYEEAEVIIAKDDVTYIDGLKYLNNKTVGVVKGYKIDEYIKANFPNIHIQYIKNYEEGLHLVSEGKIYATINSLLGTTHLMKKLNLPNIKIAGTTSLKNKYKIGILKNDIVLHSILNKAVQSITIKEKNDILSNWISIKFENRVDYTLVLYILIGSALLFILFSYWTYKLKIENKKRIEAEEKLTRLNLELEQRITKAIQENDKKEKILQQQSRLAQMGEMISMIAHQWRQPLGSTNSAAIAMNLKINIFESTQKLDTETTELLKFLSKKINNILNYTLFLSTTIDDFRNFFKPDKQIETTSVTTLINASLNIVKNTLESKQIKVITEFEADTPLELYKNEMIQVILNIIKNSEDNFLEKQPKEPFIKLATRVKDGNCIIEISDNGGGIDDTIIDEIFDPYFSTKDEKNGTGMGLYISKIIVEEHNRGKLSVSNTNLGACFTIKFKS